MAIYVKVFINEQMIASTAAQRIKDPQLETKGFATYKTSDGVILWHNPKDGAMKLSQKLLDLMPPQGNVEHKVSLKEAEEVLKTLIDKGLIKKIGDDMYQPTKEAKDTMKHIFDSLPEELLSQDEKDLKKKLEGAE